MREQATAFREESDALCAILEPLSDLDLGRKTQFNGWTINDVMAHLHSGNHSAELSLRDGATYKRVKAEQKKRGDEQGLSNLAMTHLWLDGIRNRALLTQWRATYNAVADAFAIADPRKRVPWAGRDMSARSSISARLMETWAHGQEIYDLLGKERVNTDHIRNIATLGVNTFGWTFSNRGLPVPALRPRVCLIAPSGATWEWDADPKDNNPNLIEGSAAEFCQVVAQTRNIADTRLKVSGDIAKQWMAVAQCFAGPPRTPPAAGTRFMQRGQL